MNLCHPRQKGMEQHRCAKPDVPGTGAVEQGVGEEKARVLDDVLELVLECGLLTHYKMRGNFTKCRM